MVNSRDIARLAGVSQSTVSRVLQNRPEVSSKSRARVEKVLADVGYTPNPHAQAMRNAPTNSVGVVVGRITNPFYPELLEAVGDALAAAGKRMLLWNSSGNHGEEAAVYGIRDRLVDGVIFTTATYRSDALRAALDRKAPIVLLNRSIDGVACDQLTSDSAYGTTLAARHLFELGHRRIGVIAGLQDVSTGRERRAGFLEELGRLGVTIDPRLDVACDFTHQSGYDAASRMLSAPDRPTAIFCVNDLLAFGAIDAARDLRIPIPDSLSVVGYDDVTLSSWASYNLTTVQQPLQIMAESAVSMLLQRLAEPSRPYESRRYVARLVVRASTGPVGSDEVSSIHSASAVP